MSNTYTIYIFNHTSYTQNFFCFLAPPREMANESEIYVTTSSSLSVPPNAPGQYSFVFQDDYLVGAQATERRAFPGAEFRRKGLNLDKARIRDQWSADFTVGTITSFMTRYGTDSPPGTITLKIMDFSKEKLAERGLAALASFGIGDASNFTGVVWSPPSGEIRIMTPAMQFLVVAGNDRADTLFRWDMVSRSVPFPPIDPRFFEQGKCTVTLEENGSWRVTRGAPPTIPQ
jgi:hypothetical protein